MLENLKIGPKYDGFIFLADSSRNLPLLQSHRHEELEINLLARGELTYIVDGHRYTFGQRTLLWLFPKQEHRLINRSPDALYYVAVFKPCLVANASRQKIYRDLGRQSPESGVLHSAPDPQSFDLLIKTMASIMEGSLDIDILNREAGFGYRSKFVYHHHDPVGLNAGLRYLLLLSWRCHQNGRALGGSVRLHRCVTRAVEILSSDTDDHQLPELARRCGVSPSYLSRLFAQQIGIPLSRYRNTIRLGRFWKEYHRPDSPTFTEAVYAAGFGSYSQFYKVFSSQYGSGPRQSTELICKLRSHSEIPPRKP